MAESPYGIDPTSPLSMLGNMSAASVGQTTTVVIPDLASSSLIVEEKTNSHVDFQIPYFENSNRPLAQGYQFTVIQMIPLLRIG